MNTAWYVLRSKPHKEFPLFEQVKARGIECFFPKVKVNPVNPRSAKVRPFFPSYLFVHVNIDKVGLNTFKWMPYAQGLVSFDDAPAAVSQPIIDGLQKTIQTINQKGGVKFQEINPGDRVQIIGGPFEGYEGIFDTRISGTDRVKILLQYLSDRQIPVEMQIVQIKAMRKPTTRF